MKEEQGFIIDFKRDIDDFNDKLLKMGEDDLNKKTEIINGKRNNGYYPRVKCLYDICKYIIDNNEFNSKLFKKDKVSKIKIQEVDIEDFIQNINNVTNNEINDLDWAYE